MFTCPNCRTRLRRVDRRGGVFWACAYCGGLAVSFSLLRRTIATEAFEQLVDSIRPGTGERNRSCALCDKLMLPVPFALPARRMLLDVCPDCHFAWFDPKEYGEMPPATAGEQLSKQTSQLLVNWEEQVKAGTPAEGEFRKKWLDRKWKWIPAVLGFPVERDRSLLLYRPLFTWSLAAGIVVMTVVTSMNLGPVIQQFGLIPSQAWRYGGLTFFTSFFLHGGLFHLVGNVYFLLVFGDNVEDYLGHARYVLLVFLAALTGDLLHLVLDPRSTVPVIGASGGISGLIAFYAFQFPQARLLIWSRWLFFWPLRIRARTALLLWVLLQLIGAWQQLAGFSDVSSLAHLGGASVGLLFWLNARRA